MPEPEAELGIMPDTGLRVSMQHRFPGGISLDMTFAAPLPGVVTLFGPSGSGKSSVVQCVAGLLRADRSMVRIGDAVLSEDGLWLRPERRRIGMVFQDPRLFPHLSVAANLRYGARRAAAVRLAADGGIRDTTVPLLRAAGAETVVMGSLAFGDPDLARRIAWLHALPAPGVL